MDSDEQVILEVIVRQAGKRKMYNHADMQSSFRFVIDNGNPPEAHRQVYFLYNDSQGLELTRNFISSCDDRLRLDRPGMESEVQWRECKSLRHMLLLN